MAEPLSVAVDPQVFERHPDYVAVVLVAENLEGADGAGAALAAAERSVAGRGLERAADHPHIAAWRAAFSAFGAKPSRFPCSAEALISRVLKAGSLPRIAPLVDLYNAVSVRHVLPVGGEDLDRLAGPMRLEAATGDEPFDGDESPRPGELVWRDDAR